MTAIGTPDTAQSLLKSAQAAQLEALTVLLVVQTAWSDLFTPDLQQALRQAIDSILKSAQANHQFLEESADSPV